PAAAAPHPAGHLSSGSALGPYRILRLLGAGGMGEVYEAIDSRIDRRVAVKVLPRALAADPDRLRRFQQEARAVGALNHPNLLSLFDLGEVDGLHYLVTELLEGESLRARLAEGPLAVRQAVEVAGQTAEGLAAAHERGIVHRDLKPENLFLTDEGRVKILDFGLAKLAALEGDPGWESRTGAVVGTAAYMAPEQVRGERADARADLFALGAILYELLTGESAFRRGTAIATLNAVLDEEPPRLARLDPEIPAPLATLLRGCLEKEVVRRFQSARDLAVVLRSLSGSPLPPTEVGVRRPPRRRGLAGRVPAALVAALAAGALAGVAAGLLWRQSPPAAPVLRHLTRSSNDFAPALSPDGRTVAFVSQRDGAPRIWIKELAGGGETAVTEGPDLFPRFSPDGSELLFVRFAGEDGALTKIPFPGGQPRTLLRDVFDADWAPDGARIAFVRHENTPGGGGTVLGILAPATGQTREVVRVPGRLLYQPRWSPDGDTIAAVSSGREAVVLVDVADGTVRSVAPPPPRRPLSTAVWDGPHHLLVLEAAGDLPGVATAAGACLRLDVRDGRAETLFWSPNWGQHLDSDGGRVVHSAGFSRQGLWEAEVAPDGTLGPGRWLTRGASIDRQPAYNPDGSWIVFSSDRSGNLDLWRVSASGGQLERLTDDPGVDWDPAFTADGRLVWSSDRGGRFQLWTAAADGSGARPLIGTSFAASDPAPEAPGGWIPFIGTGEGRKGLWRVRPDGAGLSRMRPGNLQLPALSPGGQRLAFLEYAGRDPRVPTLQVSEWPSLRHVAAVPLEPQSLTDLVLPGRARFWGDRYLAYLGKDAQGRPGILARDLAQLERPPLALAGFVPDFLPETFAFSPDGDRLTVSRLDLQQSLLLAELGPRRRR
ncbi:MAG TPA: protein kinase, partial [Thermoanaerobaculia bacterium]|nr:protein kinase [Thermoanaerobaculia bacterium]